MVTSHILGIIAPMQGRPNRLLVHQDTFVWLAVHFRFSVVEEHIGSSVVVTATYPALYALDRFTARTAQSIRRRAQVATSARKVRVFPRFALEAFTALRILRLLVLAHLEHSASWVHGLRFYALEARIVWVSQ
jgi:hypothetical protein